MSTVLWKEEHHDDGLVGQWFTVRLFGWSLGHGMGMVA
jgi:hypothetical protein